MERVYVESIRNAKLGKARGPDGISMELFKFCSLFLVNTFMRCSRQQRG